MKDVAKNIKGIWDNNRIVCLFILVLLTFVVVFLSMVLPMYAKNGDKYGDRLAGITDVKIDADINDDVKELLQKNENVAKVKTVQKGKIYNILIYLNDNVDVNTVVDSAESIVDVFTKDKLNYYDIQIFITSKIESEEGKIEKTIVGYRNSQKESFSWTNNR